MIRKAIIPAAGLGTRMLPATKAIPKEMLTIVNKPVIQYVVEEAIQSGITDILIVTSKGKGAMNDHFASDFPSASYYKEKGKNDLLESLKAIGGDRTIEFIEQPELNGLGDAIYLGKNWVGGEAFAALLGDTICSSQLEKPVLGQLMEVYNRFQCSVTAIEEVQPDLVSKYGIMSGDSITDGLYQVNKWVEKPEPHLAPSNLAIAARYIFTPGIFDCLENIERGLNNEVQVTDAMDALLKKEVMYALQFKGQRFDVGNPLGFIKTNLHFGMRDSALRRELGDWLTSRGYDPTPKT